MIDWLTPRASSFAGDIDWLFALILVFVGFWFVVAEIVLFSFLFGFRRRPALAARYVTGTEKREKRWISVPHALIILCDVVIIVATLGVWAAVKQNFPPADEKIRIVAQQWAWTFVHPGPDGKLDTEDDIVTLDELRVRAGTTYHFEVTARDVIHSFSVPAFRLKQDAVPGRVITGWFQPTTPGEYDIQCAEMCGIGHALMPARLVVETKEQHDQWMQQAAASADGRVATGPGGPQWRTR
jgi:cytochrome c oxidase subunit II